jgi:hypothetical protein
MAIDYAIQLPCAVRQQVPEPKLLSMVKYKDRAQFAIEQFRQAQPGMDLATIVNECTVRILVQTPEGVSREMPVTIAQMLSMVAPLEHLKGACKGCPANVWGRDFGCIGGVNYPIATQVEEWLVARMPDDAKSPGMELLFKFLADLDIDGAPVEAHRARKEMFESRTPAVRKWGSWFARKKQLSSSQVLHMLAFGGPIGPQQAQLYTKLLDLVDMKADRSSAKATEQFRAFLRAIVTAGKLNAGVHVDS